MNQKIKILISKYLPGSIKKIVKLPLLFMNELILHKKIKKAPSSHRKALDRVRKKSKAVRVIFLMINTDTWKYHSVYTLFKQDVRFEPTVIICPFTGKGNNFLASELKKSEQLCKEMEYDFLIGYDIETQTTVKIKTRLKPDIVFFTNPNNLTTNEFLISNYTDTLTCYVPYSFRIDTLYDYNFNNPLVNLSWIVFYESEIHKQIAMKFAANKGGNVVVSGYPNLEKPNTQKSKNPWKTHTHQKKRIIWGPHWTIKGYQNTSLDWSCFLEYADFFLELANEFSNEIQLALKPHPFLRSTLEKEELWGKEKTNEYYNSWEIMENTQIVDGNYNELFIHSDALIHDSGSFLTEYLVLNKPVAYTLNVNEYDQRFNEFGLKAIDAHTIIHNKKELKVFILNLLDDNDELKHKRENFISTNLDSNTIASENIKNYITNQIKL